MSFNLEIRDVAPGDSAVRLTGTRADGLPDGIHTGGAWLFEGEVWKPLDGRPYMNAQCHVPTEEAECLAEVEGDLFPRNWRVEERNGRRFLVRPEASVVGSACDWTDIPEALALRVEAAIYRMNALGWELGDEITLARARGEWFVVDLSAAHRVAAPWTADDRTQVARFLTRCGMGWLVKVRDRARHALSIANQARLLAGGGDRFLHIYASFNRPMSPAWARFPVEVEYVHNERADWGEAIPWTWVLSSDPIPAEKLASYELRTGWPVI